MLLLRNLKTRPVIVFVILLSSCSRPADKQGGCDPYMIYKADDQNIVEFDTMSYQWNEIDTIYVKRYDSMEICTDSTIWARPYWAYPPNAIAGSAFDRFHEGKSKVKYYELGIKGRPEKFIFRDFRVFRFKPDICSEKSEIVEVTINNIATETFPYKITK